MKLNTMKASVQTTMLRLSVCRYFFMLVTSKIQPHPGFRLGFGKGLRSLNPKQENMSEASAIDDEPDDDEFNPEETEAQLEALYRPGCYREGEELCVEILEYIDPDWEPARMYLLLFYAAQDFDQAALETVDELQTESLLEALLHLTFGAGTETEELIYEDIMACMESRGLEERLEAFFAEVEQPLARQDIALSLASWD